MSRLNWLFWKGAIDVEPILNHPKAKELHSADTFGGTNEEWRRSKIAWMTSEKEIQDIIAPFAFEAAKLLDVDINFHNDIQYTEYHATDKGHYSWHNDVDWTTDKPTDRKLSLTVQLSDPSEYEGGTFEFSQVEQVPEEAKTKGTVLVFLSPLDHRVTPVTEGVRKSLVSWYEGPRWR